jgi:hypothetical protein
MPTGSPVFLGQRAELLGLGPACTMEAGATTDRWCAFFVAPSATALDGALFVVNVSKAAAGVSITCAGTDANCLKLTDTLAQDRIHPSLFQGDNLVYYDGPWKTPFGWRPGMSAGKALAVVEAGGDAICRPATKGSAYTCMDYLPAAKQTEPNAVLVDLLAGHLESTTTPPLARIESVIAGSSFDVNVTHLQIGFPIPGGERIAWSARSSATGPEVLKMQTLGDDASRATIATGVTRWDVSPDGARWYWLTGMDEITGLGGTMLSAPFPAGTSPVTIASNPWQYDFPTPSTMLLLDSGRAMTFFADPIGAPAAGQLLDSPVDALLAFDGNGHVAYIKMITGSAASIGGSDLFVKTSDGTHACTLTAATDANPLFFVFTASSGGAVWQRKTLTSTVLHYTRLADCLTMTVAANVASARVLGDRGILFVDGFDPTPRIGTLKLRGLGPDGAVSLAAATTLSRQVGSLAVAASGGVDTVIYTVSGGGSDDGVYVKGFGP